MRVNIVPIGNSRGLRIPKVVLEQCHISKEVIMEVDKGRIIIMPDKMRPRKDWEKSFKSMHDAHEDTLIIEDKIDLNYGDWEW